MNCMRSHPRRIHGALKVFAGNIYSETPWKPNKLYM
jgi:hypothetical protein